jgi:hypothetical protein
MYLLRQVRNMFSRKRSITITCQKSKQFGTYLCLCYQDKSRYLAIYVCLPKPILMKTSLPSTFRGR